MTGILPHSGTHSKYWSDIGWWHCSVSFETCRGKIAQISMIIADSRSYRKCIEMKKAAKINKLKGLRYLHSLFVNHLNVI